MDFPKGKADEGETDIECACREIGEEIGFNIKPHINEQHYIKIETIQGKFVKLFLVCDIDEEKALIDHQKLLATSKNSFHKKKFVEAHKIEWIETEYYLGQTLLTGVDLPDKYNWQYVQPFAYYVSQWI